MRISELAYERAQDRGFASGNELDDWLASEREFDHSMSATPSDEIDSSLTPNASKNSTAKNLNEKAADTSYVTTDGIREA